MNNTYSEKEIQMFMALGYSDLMWVVSSEPAIYRLAIERCFLENRQGAAVDSLRRAGNALSKAKPYRMTEQFDALIIL